MSKVIMVVDDEPDTLVLLNERLKNAGYGVVSAFSGDEVIQKVQTSLPNLILLDIVMPGINGYRICRRLKDDEKTKDIPIILFTALQKTDLVTAAQASGADMVLSKTIEIDALLGVIRQFLKE